MTVERQGPNMLDFLKAKRRVAKLIEALETAIRDDPEQEVRGMAIPVLDAAIIAIKKDVASDRVIRVVEEVISPAVVERGEPVRAVDALLAAKQLDAALGDSPLFL